MSKYQELMRNSAPFAKKVKKEVIFEMVSCMCDNRAILRMRKNDEGEFKLTSPPRNGGWGNALSNFQFKYPTYEIEWAADEGKWLEVSVMINSGTSLIESVKSR